MYCLAFRFDYIRNGLCNLDSINKHLFIATGKKNEIYDQIQFPRGVAERNEYNEWLTAITRLSPFIQSDCCLNCRSVRWVRVSKRESDNKVTHYNMHASLCLCIVYYMHHNCRATLHRLSKRVITRLPFKSCCVCVCLPLQKIKIHKNKQTKPNKRNSIVLYSPSMSYSSYVNSHEENKMLNTQLKNASMRRVQCVFIAHSFAFVNFKDKQNWSSASDHFEWTHFLLWMPIENKPIPCHLSFKKKIKRNGVAIV